MINQLDPKMLGKVQAGTGIADSIGQSLYKPTSYLQAPKNNALADSLSYGAKGASLGANFGPYGVAIGAAAGVVGGAAKGFIDYKNDKVAYNKDVAAEFSNQKRQMETQNPYSLMASMKKGGSVSGKVKGSGNHENPVQMGEGGHMIPRNMEKVALPLLKKAGVNTDRELPKQNGNVPILAEENERYVAPQDVKKFESKTGIPIESLSPNSNHNNIHDKGGPVVKYDKTWDIPKYQFDENYLPKSLEDIHGTFDNIRDDAQSILKSQYPNKNYTVNYTGDTRSVSQAANNAKAGTGATTSMHQIGGARDFNIMDNGVLVPGNTDKGLNLYKNSVWESATKKGFNHLRTPEEGSNGGINGLSDPYHIGVVQERGDGTAFKRAFDTYPSLRNDPATIATEKEMIAQKNNPAYSALYNTLYTQDLGEPNLQNNNSDSDNDLLAMLPSDNAKPSNTNPWDIVNPQEDNTQAMAKKYNLWKNGLKVPETAYDPNAIPDELKENPLPQEQYAKAPVNGNPVVQSTTAKTDDIWKDFNKANNLQLGLGAADATWKTIYNAIQKYQPIPNPQLMEAPSHTTDFGAVQVGAQRGIDRAVNTALYNARNNNQEQTLAPAASANQMEQQAVMGTKIELMRQDERNKNNDARVATHNQNVQIQNETNRANSEGNNKFRLMKGEAISQTTNSLVDSVKGYNANKFKKDSILAGLNYSDKYTGLTKLINSGASETEIKKYITDHDISI